jgi:hypothetical protein
MGEKESGKGVDDGDQTCMAKGIIMTVPHFAFALAPQIATRRRAGQWKGTGPRANVLGRMPGRAGYGDLDDLTYSSDASHLSLSWVSAMGERLGAACGFSCSSVSVMAASMTSP